MTTIATTLNDVVDRAAVQLLDPGNVRWARATVIGFVNEAMREILAHRPDAFALTTDLTLQPGAEQRLPDEYSALSSVESSVAPNGTPKRVHEGDYRYYRLQRSAVTPRRGANPARDFTVRTYVKHPIDDRIWYADPPVPPDAHVRVRATVIRVPGNYSATEGPKALPIRPEFESQVLDWVCYRCLSGEHESQQAREMAKVYLEAFIKLMGLKDKAALRFSNGGHDPTPAEMTAQRMGATK